MKSLAAAVVVVALVANVSMAAPAEDEVTSLPGLTYKPNFDQWSGYLNVTGSAKRLHYWAVESQNDPANDPVILWLNGGPGCSSLDGFLSEHGPFHLRPGGKELYENPYAWNKVANVIYLEAPAGVGFSYSTDSSDYTTDDDTTSHDNLLAVRSFFDKFPEWKQNDFFVTGESYGGVYVPTLTKRIQDFNQAAPSSEKINLVGFATGNGYSSSKLLSESVIFFAYFHGLIDLNLWKELGQACCSTQFPEKDQCNFGTQSNAQCQAATAKVMNLIYGGTINWYALYLPCSNTPNERMIRAANLIAGPWDVKIGQKSVEDLQQQSGRHLLGNVPCIDTEALNIWLNNPDVQKALHVNMHRDDQWSICSNVLKYTQQYDDMISIYPGLLEDFRSLVYNGDTDMACNFLGDQWAVEGLGLNQTEAYREWMVDGQVAGFVKKFGDLALLTVKGAGHMVPQWKPPQALAMITAFIHNKPY